MNNKEYGSDFHYVLEPNYLQPESLSHFLNEDYQLCFSGRGALRQILTYGIENENWKKIYLPTYYCHEVYDFISDINIEIEFYQFNPLTSEFPNTIQDEKDYVLLITNYFGISTPSFNHFSNLVTIEDLTHDLSLINCSQANYVFGSLRKILPLPVGGFVKSMKVLPKLKTNLFSEEVALEKLTGMVLKNKYLNGEFKDKEVFRNLLINSEHRLENLKTYSVLPKLVEDYLFRLNIEKVIDTKKKNSLFIKRLITENDEFKLLTSNRNSEYALILKFESLDVRNLFKSYLISQNIFPFILWPNQITEEDKELENSLLFIHIDFRYSEVDMEYIANIVNQFN